MNNDTEQEEQVVVSELGTDEVLADHDQDEVMTDSDWLSLSERSFKDSTDYLDTALRGRMERNYASALSRHPSGSKYNSDQYKNRSKTFRGKTAAAIRRNMAAFSVAMFSTQSAVSITAENDGDKEQERAADAIDVLQNFHLRRSFPWLKVANGAFRESLINPVIFSKQWWRYETKLVEGKDGKVEENVIIDAPIIELLPTENVRISPAADWLEPIRTSPYVILEFPMYLGDIKERMDQDWIEHDYGTIDKVLSSFEYDSIRTAREDNRPDSKGESTAVRDHDLVWVRENFIKHGGECYHYYSIRNRFMLTEAVPVAEVYPHCKNGVPPIRFGSSDIEAFVLYAQTMTERTEGAQIQANDIANQRADNIQQTLNTRKLVKRNSGVDYRSLLRNVPGATTLTDDMDAVKEMESKDVTGSAFQEQNMVNMDFDELAGTFSVASVATNRDLGETVGGMQLLSGNSNVTTEFTLKIFVESWVELVMGDVAEMIKLYEETSTIQRITGDNTLTHADLNKNTVVNADVGFGATDPTQKVNKLLFAISAASKFIPDLATKASAEEILAEIMGSVGFKNSKRFFPGVGDDGDPQVRQLKDQIEKLTAIIKEEQVKVQGEKALLSMKLNGEMALAIEAKDSAFKEHQSRERLEEMKLHGKAMEIAARDDLDVRDVTKQFKLKEMDGDQQRTLEADKTKAKIHMERITGGEGGGFFPG